MSPTGPDERLRAAAALVVVDDLDHPRLEDPDAHHLLDVLRLETGALVAATDGAGRARLCRFEAPGPRGRRRPRDARLEPVGEVLAEDPPERRLTVAFALVKGDRSEWAVQKLTELGVDRIVPVLSERTVVRLDPDGLAKRAERLRRVAREAAGQSRRLRLPEVAAPVAFDDFVAGETGGGAGAATGALALAEPGGDPLRADTAAVVVGPEGGWSDAERDRVRPLLGLGPTVLRAETAAVVAGALLVAARAGTVRAAGSE